MRFFRLTACVILTHLFALILLGRNHTLKKEPSSSRKVAVQTISLQPKQPSPPPFLPLQPPPELQSAQPEPPSIQSEPQPEPEPQSEPEPQLQPQTPAQPQKIPAAPAIKPKTAKPSSKKKGTSKKTSQKATPPQQKNQKALLSLAKSALSELDATTPKGLSQSRTTTSYPTVEVHEASYSDLIISYLQDQLTLPERGEVKLRLTVTREGKITSHTILFSTENNRTYIEKALNTIVLPTFGSRFKGEKSHTFSITLTTLSD